ncbi:hypothetical protein MNBD_GAMMA12-141 [hydrothermal vent metagenome]|uniref:STAS domain-containing protein n=1 Tax=hydrothermal vent metagenome TaxID=652676 RepID=A0A3B0YC33_9ZZZZ
MDSKNLFQVTMNESMDISKAQELKNQLQEALLQQDGIHLDMSNLERIDTAVIQLLMIFAKTAESKKIPIEWDRQSNVFNRAVRILNVEEYFFQTAA